MNSFFSSKILRLVSYITLSLPIFFISCAVPLEILPNLCYTDKTGTYICPSSCEEDLKEFPSAIESCHWTPQIEIKRVAEKKPLTPEELYKMRLYDCRMFLGSDAWDWCMGNEAWIG